MGKAKLYAARVGKRAMTVLDVPKDMRGDVMQMLSDSDRARSERILAEATTVTGRPPKKQLLEQAGRLGIEVPEGATNPEIAAMIRGQA